MKLLKWLAVFALIYLAVSAIGGYFIVEGALHPAKKELTEQTFRRATTIATQVNASLIEVSIHAKDGIFLKAWYFDEHSDSKSNCNFISWFGRQSERHDRICTAFPAQWL